MGVSKRPRVKRDALVLCRLSEREQQILNEAAKAAGVSISEVLRYGLHMWAVTHPQPKAIPAE